MKRSIACSVLLVVVYPFIGAAWADENVIVDTEAAENFATMPDGVRFPEGITANLDTGDIYVGTFDFGPNDNQLVRFDADGNRLAQINFGGTPLLGLAFNSRDSKVYIGNFGASQIQRIDADFTDATTIADVETVAIVPGIGAPPNRMVGNPDGSEDVIQFGSNFFPAPNALAFKDNGDLFVSDSFQGAIFRIKDPTKDANTCPSDSGCVDTVAHDALLATAGFPPFGANGLAFKQAKLFIANTGDDRVLRLNIGSGAIDVFSESINGADGIAFDDEGILWVAANQADQVAALNDDGRVIAELGEFLGIDDGSPEGLLFPASLVIIEDKIFVTNLSLPLTGVVGDEPEEDVLTYTVSEIDLPDL